MTDIEKAHEEFLEAAKQHALENDLRQQLKIAQRRADKRESRDYEYAQAVYDAAKQAASLLTIPPVKAPKKDTRKKHAEVAVLGTSDWQLAKVTPTYATEVTERRIAELGEKVVLLTDIQRADHPVKEVHVNFLGDEVEGELIFPGQQHLIDASLYEQVCVSGPRITVNLLRYLAANFEIVRVRHADGNHGALGGRARKDYHPESNADSMMLRIAQMLTEDEPRIIWDTQKPQGERHWYDIDQVFDHRILLFHGNQIKGGALGFPWYGFGKKLQGWYTGLDLPDAVKGDFETRFTDLSKQGMDENDFAGAAFDLALQLVSGGPFRYAMGGHFHTPVRFYQNGITYWGNGSTESSNTYALESLAAAGEPCQQLLFFHPDGVSSEHLVRLSL